LQSISHPKLLNLTNQLRYELVVDLVKKVKPLDGETRLSTIEKPSDGCCTDRFVDIRVLAHDHGIASAELKRDTLDVLRGDFHDVLSSRCRSGESNLPDTGVFEERFANNPCGAGHDVQHARRKSGFIQNLYGLNVRERRRSGRLHDDSVSGNQRRADFV